jgi:hypothetical protein
MTRMTRIRKMCVQIRVVRGQTLSHETRILKTSVKSVKSVVEILWFPCSYAPQKRLFDHG